MFRGTASRVTVFNPHPPSMKPAGLGKVVSLLMWAIVVRDSVVQYEYTVLVLVGLILRTVYEYSISVVPNA